MKSNSRKVLAPAVLAAMITIDCTCPLLSTAARRPAVTATPTKTPRPSAAATSIVTPMTVTPPSPTVALAPTETLALMPTPTPSSTPAPPTATRRPAVATPTRHPATPTPRSPTATSTIPYPYSLHASVEYSPDCALTILEGTIWDINPANQVRGVLLKVCVEGEFWCDTVVTGQDPSKGGGYYSAVLGPEGPRAGNWWVAVVDAQGRALSQAVLFRTDTQNCDLDGTGHQRVIIDFRRNY